MNIADALKEAYEQGKRDAQSEPCEDAVSRRKVFEYFVSLWECIGTIMDRDEWEDVCKTTANELPSVAPKAEQRWIPCSERLPENGRQVLVYARSVHYALAKYDEMREADGTYKKQWVTFDAWKPFYTIKEVTAWMPLPEVYRKEGDE